MIGPDGREVALADPLEPEELTAELDAAALRRARLANPAHGIERHEMLIEALEQACRPEARPERATGVREETRP